VLLLEHYWSSCARGFEPFWLHVKEKKKFLLKPSNVSNSKNGSFSHIFLQKCEFERFFFTTFVQIKLLILVINSKSFANRKNIDKT